MREARNSREDRQDRGDTCQGLGPHSTWDVGYMAPGAHGKSSGRTPHRVHGDTRYPNGDERVGAVAWIAPYIGKRYHLTAIGISSILVIGGFWVFLIEVFGR